MKFLGGSPLSDEQLETLSRSIVAAYGEHALFFVNHLIGETIASGERDEHATWVNVAFGVLQILRPDRIGENP